MAQFQVGQLERSEMFWRSGSVEITGLDARELGQVVDHLQQTALTLSLSFYSHVSLQLITSGKQVLIHSYLFFILLMIIMDVHKFMNN